MNKYFNLKIAFVISIIVFITAINNIYAQGNPNKVLDLNNAYVNVGNDGSLKPSSEITVEAFVKPDNYVGSGWGGAGYILGDSRDCCSNSGGIGLHLTGTNGAEQIVRGYFYTPGSINNGALKSVFSTNYLQPNEWTHIAMVFNGTSLKLLINGVLDNETLFDQNIINTNTIDFFIGGTGYLVNWWKFHGRLDEIRIWNYARTQQEIQTNMYDVLTGNETGLVGYWNFNDSTVNDLSPNNNDGAMVGDATIISEEIPMIINANFTASDTTITLGNTIQFTDLSTGNPTSWQWDFGDGTTDALQNPTYIYQTAGTYSVSLVVSDGVNNDTLIRMDYINVQTQNNTFSCGDIISDIEGNQYNTVQIGDQCWMKENLRTGSMIQGNQEMTDNGIIEKYCTDNVTNNCIVYGGLYKWDELMQYNTQEGIQGICPTDWHIPTDEEWTILSDFLGGEDIAGGKMKETGTNHWNSPNTGATNESGFLGLPGGYRDYYNGNFDHLNTIGHFWSSSLSYTMGIGRSLTYNDDDLSSYNHMLFHGFSVRCIKNPITSTSMSINLNTGWNISSFNIIPQYTLMDSVFDPLISESSLLKVMDESGGLLQEITGTGWTNTIGNMENSEGYYIKVNQNTQLSLSGLLVETPFDIPLSTGWNIMGYPMQDSNNAIEVLQPLIDSSYLTKVLAETGGFIQEIPEAGWINTIDFFKAGKGYYLKVNQNCSLTIGREPPLLTTNSVSSITQTTAVCGGEITSNQGAIVTARGVCWSTAINPTLADTYTTDGTGIGAFVSNITGLTANTQYYVRAYATNGEGTAYGNDVAFTTLPPTLATVTTNTVTNITSTTATSGGNVTSSGGASVTTRGVCWSTSSNPTLTDSYTTDGSDNGAFISNLTGLTENSTYYVKAYATNSVGTTYGNEVSFVAAQPPFNCSDLLTYEGQIYTTVQIGTQCWMAENLNVGTMINGSNNQTNNGTIEKYCFSNSTSNCDTYGGLYQWNEMMQYVTSEGVQGICPNGWHIPTDTEWTTLTTHLGSESVAGGKMKEAGTNHWNPPNTGATNEYGFTGLPGGYRSSSGSLFNLGGYGGWWSSTEYSGSDAWDRSLYYDNNQVGRNGMNKTTGHSVRCLKY